MGPLNCLFLTISLEARLSSTRSARSKGSVSSERGPYSLDNPFRINTCKSVWKQGTCRKHKSFRINTYKNSGEGVWTTAGHSAGRRNSVHSTAGFHFLSGSVPHL